MFEGMRHFLSTLTRLSQEQHVFNYWLSEAIQVTVKERYCRIQTGDVVVDKLVKATVIFHNLLRDLCKTVNDSMLVSLPFSGGSFPSIGTSFRKFSILEISQISLGYVVDLAQTGNSVQLPSRKDGHEVGRVGWKERQDELPPGLLPGCLGNPCILSACTVLQ